MFVSLLYLASSAITPLSCEPEYVGTVLNSSRDCKEVVVRSDSTAIGEEAFAESNLESIDCSNANQLTLIDYRAFVNSSKLSKVILPSSLKIIGSNAFSGCTSLKTITIPQSVTFIGYSAFRSCTKLERIDLNCNIESLLPFIFAECNSLLEFAVPVSVKKILSSAFRKCKSLQRVNLHECIEYIGDYAFSLTKIRKIQTPASLKYIGEYAFSNCPWLESVNLQNSDVKILTTGVFSETNKLYRIELPSMLKQLERNALARSGVRTLSLPDSVVKLADNSIQNCNNLKTIKLPRKLPKFGTNVFRNTNSPCQLQSKSEYTEEQINQLKAILPASAFDENCGYFNDLPDEIEDNFGLLTAEQIEMGYSNPPPPTDNNPQPGKPENPRREDTREEDREDEDSDDQDPSDESGDDNEPGTGNPDDENPNVENPKDAPETTPTSNDGHDHSKPDPQNSQDGLTTGKIVGFSVGAIAGVAAVVVGIAIFIMLTRKAPVKKAKSDDNEFDINI